jgi:GxxExxY protein
MTSQGLHLPLGRLTGEIIGAFHEVVAELGCGYGELVHQRALKIAVCDRGLLAEDNLSIGVRFRGHDIGTFRPDLVVERLVIVEVKAVSTLDPSATAQILNYLRSAGGGVGLLVNFGSKPKVERFVSGHPPISLPLLPKDPVKDISRWLPQDVMGR